MAKSKFLAVLKSRSGRRPISVSNLLRKEKDGTLFKHTKLGADFGSEQSRMEYREGDPSHSTGKPALPKRKKNELPSREEMDNYPKSENRQDQRSSDVAGSFPQAEGFHDVGKYAESPGVDRALGNQRKKWEGPTREEMGKAPPEKHVGQGGFVQLSDVSTSVGQDESKTASSPLGAALLKLSGRGFPKRRVRDEEDNGEYESTKGGDITSMAPGSAPADGYSKSASRLEAAAEVGGLGMLAAPVIDNMIAASKVRKAGLPETERNLEKFRTIKAKYHEPLDVAGLGTLAAPYVPKLISKRAMVDELGTLNALTGSQLEKVSAITAEEAEKSLKHLRRLEATKPSLGEAFRGALVGGAVGPVASITHRAASGPEARMGKPILLRTAKGRIAIRPHIANVAQGAVFGSLLPFGRHALEREVEKQKLREYVGVARGGTLRSQIKKTVGL